MMTEIDALIQRRHSVRAFRPDPVSQEALTEMLAVASRAVSAGNLQPWRVHVLTDAALKRVTAAVCHAFDTEPEKHTSEFDILPKKNFDPYLARRRKLGFAMYDLIGIEKGDKVKMLAQHRKNLEFFDAPVGIYFTMDRKLPMACFLDLGAFMQNLMLSAKARGLDTCLQTFWCDYHRVISRELNFAEDEMLVAGMCLGYADETAPINKLVSERESVSVFASFVKA